MPPTVTASALRNHHRRSMPMVLTAAVAVALLLSSPLPSLGFGMGSSPSMVLAAGGASAKAAPSSSVGAPFSRDEFDAYVQNTYSRLPITIRRGDGCRLYDDAGKEYLDFVAGISTCALGHANKELADAVAQQMNRLHHVSNLYYIPQQGVLARWLVENSPASRAFFCNSGAEANEAAIKLSRKYGHTKLGLDFPVIITARDSFHGRTLGAITATGQPKYQKSFSPLPKGFVYVDYNNVEELRKTVKRINRLGRLRGLLGRGRKGVAAIMMEPLQGEGGVRPATPEFFKAVRDICDETGALMMCDEVQTGMGRTGKLWGFENLGVEPDVFTTAKALGGGLPIGAMLCKEHCDVFAPGDHASTFGGNPLCCAAATVVTSRLDKGLLDAVQARSRQLHKGLQALATKHSDVIEGYRGWGLLCGLVFREDCPLVASVVAGKAVEQGLLLVPAGPKVLRFVPPLVIMPSDVEAALERADKAIQAAKASLP